MGILPCLGRESFESFARRGGPSIVNPPEIDIDRVERCFLDPIGDEQIARDEFHHRKGPRKLELRSVMVTSLYHVQDKRIPADFETLRNFPLSLCPERHVQAEFSCFSFVFLLASASCVTRSFLIFLAVDRIDAREMLRQLHRENKENVL